MTCAWRQTTCHAKKPTGIIPQSKFASELYTRGSLFTSRLRRRLCWVIFSWFFCLSCLASGHDHFHVCNSFLSLIASTFRPVVLLSQLLTASLNKLNIIQLLWYVTLCYWFTGSRRFEGPWCLHLQESRGVRWTLFAGTECQSRTVTACRGENSVVRPGAQIPDSRWPRPLNFVRSRLIFVDPQRGT